MTAGEESEITRADQLRREVAGVTGFDQGRCPSSFNRRSHIGPLVAARPRFALA
jgi:hypothetical protein